MTQNAPHVVLLGAITIDSTNNALVVKEGATTTTLTIASGTYYLRGDGTSGDFAVALKTVLESHGGSNTYTITVIHRSDDAQAHASVVVTRATGSNDFSLLFANASTTFRGEDIGFEQTDTTHDAFGKTGTITPRTVWVSGQVRTSSTPRFRTRFVSRRSWAGRPHGVRRGAMVQDRVVVVEYQSAGRTLTESEPVTGTSFQSWLDVCGDGRQIEMHESDITSEPIVDALGTSTRIGSTWTLAQSIVEDWEPTRFQPGIPIYSWSIPLEEVPA